MGPIGGLSARQFNSCLPRIGDKDELDKAVKQNVVCVVRADVKDKQKSSFFERMFAH